MKANTMMPISWDKYSMDNFYDEMVEPSGQIRPCYEHLTNRMSGLGFEEVVGRQHAADRAFRGALESGFPALSRAVSV